MGSQIYKIAVAKINENMKDKRIPSNGTRTISPGIDWKSQREGQELSFPEIRYRADYSAFKKAHSE